MHRVGQGSCLSALFRQVQIAQGETLHFKRSDDITVYVLLGSVDRLDNRRQFPTHTSPKNTNTKKNKDIKLKISIRKKNLTLQQIWPNSHSSLAINQEIWISTTNTMSFKTNAISTFIVFSKKSRLVLPLARLMLRRHTFMQLPQPNFLMLSNR